MCWHDHRGYCDMHDYKEIPITNLPKFKRKPINHSRRVYNNGEYVDNGVALEDLDNHIEYNKTMRFGTALFINGVCVNRGYLTKKRCNDIEAELARLQIEMKTVVIPYQ